ncbi:MULTISPECIES: hypothetical protein [unclassified Streptomyces]
MHALAPFGGGPKDTGSRHMTAVVGASDDDCPRDGRCGRGHLHRPACRAR